MLQPINLIRVSKYGVVSSLTALLAFLSKNSIQVRTAFIYLSVGAIAVFLICCLWERESIQSEEKVDIAKGEISKTVKKRAYLLPPEVRLEIAVSIAVVVASALVGSI